MTKHDLDDSPQQAAPGHVFVVKGDLTKLACDALIVPTAAEVEITSPWRAVVAASRIHEGRGNWYRVDVDRPRDWTRGVRAFRLPEQSLDRDVWLVQTGWDDATPAWVVDGLLEGLTTAHQHLRAPSKVGGRQRPLIGVPLVGTGAGGLAGRRGELIRERMPRLERLVSATGMDVALVLNDDRDAAAVQHIERPSGLDAELERHADGLAGRAARGELVLFIGAGVSMAAGMPSWAELLDELATEAGYPRGTLAGLPPLDAAEVAQIKMGQRFPQYMAERFTMRRHALAHALLASLQVQAAVTTNYDNGYELASAALKTPAPLRVLPRERALSGGPWLLKLHGDVVKPESIVLTRQQYLAHGETAAPLTGMVQSLLLTRHMLFVGFSLVDDTFARLTHQVRRVLAQALRDTGTVGTVLHLRDDPARAQLYAAELQHIHAGGRDEHVDVAARRLELFLDRLLSTTARLRDGSERYLLDDRYAGMPWMKEERSLRTTLLALAADVDPQVRRTAAWDRVREALADLGHSQGGPPQAPLRRRG